MANLSYDELLERCRQAEEAVARLTEAEKRANRLSSVLRAILNVGQLIVREKDPQRLIDQACNNLTENMGYHNAWISMVDEGGVRAVMSAASGFEQGFEAMRARLDRGELPDCMRKALALGEMVVIDNPVTACRDCLHAQEYSGRAGFCHQLEYAGKIFGALVVSVPAAFSGDAEERRLFAELSSDLSFALHEIETEKARLEMEGRYASLFENNHAVMLLLDPGDGAIVDANPAAEAFYGWSRQELIRKKITEINTLPPEQIHREIEAAKEARRNHFFFKHRRADDSVCNVEVYSGAIKVKSRDLLYSIVHDITDRKRAEEALDRERQQLLSIFDSIDEPIYVCDPESYEILFVNQALRKLTPGEPIGNICYRVFQGLDSPCPFCTNDIIREIYPEPYHWEYYNPALDRTFYIHDRMIRWPDGRNVRLEFAIDITGQKKAEASLIESKALLDTAGRIARLGGWSFNLSENRLIWSDQVAAIHAMPEGYSPGVEEGILFYAPEYREKIARLFHACVTEGAPYDEEMEIVTGQGKRVWVRTTGEAVRDQSDAIVRAQGAFQDITERIVSELELRKSEQRLQTLMEQAPISIEIYDLDGFQIAVNKAYKEMFAVPSDWALKRFNVLRSEEIKRLGFLESIERVYAGEVITITEHQFDPARVPETGRIGRSRWLNTVVFPLKDPAGKVMNIVVIHSDITDRKQAEADRESLQSQLLQAQKMESVGRLAGGVAHDFNNMLGVILGRAELALNSLVPSDKVYFDLEEIRKAAERSAELTRQLLAFARKQTVAPRVLDLNDTIEGMLKMLRRLIGEDIDLVWLPARDLCPIKMDPSQIDQVLANLCVNARDAIHGMGKVTIETANVHFDEAYCATHPGFAPGDFALLAFSDDGCGMDKETLAKIFEPFFTTKEFGKGTGLGTAMIYGIIRQNNGFVNVYSEPGAGTTFKIYFPRHLGQPGRAELGTSEKALRRGSETILIVEDEAAILNVAKMMLGHLGYSVLTANSAQDAIRLAEEHAGEIHLLMTDVIMPDMNGRDLARKLMALYPSLKCLFMSGYTANVIAHHGVLDAGVYFIQKPFSITALDAKLCEVLGDE